MATKDFEVEQLASYLHLAPAQIVRMAERGRLPGRKIGGKWVFAEAEIHHWLEERIGVSDAEELVEMEGVLEKKLPDDSPDSICIHDLVPPGAIAMPLSARTRSSVISSMVELAANSGLLWDPEKMADAVRAREQLHPTALDNGVALLHPRRPLPNILAEPLIALGKSDKGIPFGGPRGGLTDIFFLICSTDDRVHLRVLARLSRLVAEADFLTGIREAHDEQTVRELIVECEEKMSG